MSVTDAGKRRARDAGIAIGLLAPGPHNAISDVPGVRVGHRTVWRGNPGGTEPVARTGSIQVGHGLLTLRRDGGAERTPSNAPAMLAPYSSSGPTVQRAQWGRRRAARRRSWQTQ